MRMRESTFSCIDINRKAFKGIKFYKCFITAFPLGKFHMRKNFHLKLEWNRMKTAPIWEPKTSYTYFQYTNFIRWIPRLRMTLISSFMRNLWKNEDSYCACDLPRILTPAAGKIQEIGGSGKEMQKCWRSLIHDPYSLSLKGERQESKVREAGGWGMDAKSTYHSPLPKQSLFSSLTVMHRCFIY